MGNFRLYKIPGVLAIVAIAVAVFGFATEHLWNWLVPAIFGLRAISFVEALGLVLLSKILFGGFHRHGGRGRGWRRRMNERWEEMTPEERERCRAGMRGCRGRRANAASASADTPATATSTGQGGL